VRLIRAEMEELHAIWVERVGSPEADRRVRRQWRQYPWLLLANRARGRRTMAPPSRVVDPASGGPWFTLQGLRQGLRSLAKAPGLTAAIVLTVGLGVGGCTTIFALVDVLYLQPLPYRDADRLEQIYTATGQFRFPFSVVDFQALQQQQTSFERVGAFAIRSHTLLTSDGAEVIPTIDPTPGLVDVLGTPVAHGRTPTVGEGAPDAPPTVMVTAGFAQRFLGTGPDGAEAVGKTINLDGESYEVIGVLAASLGPLARGVDVLPTLRLSPPSRKGPFFLRVFGRLRPGVAAEVAASELTALNARLFPLWADSYQDRNATWRSIELDDYIRADSGPLLAVLMGAVAMLLLIAMANSASLLTARVSGRARELAVREALGASRGRIWGHLLLESGLLAVGGVAVGLGAARLGVAALPVVASTYLRRTADAQLSGHVVGFALLLAAVCGLLFATVPALHRRRSSSVGHELRTGSRGSTAGPARQRTQRFLFAAEVAIVMPLLVGAFLLLGSFLRLQSVDPGFDAAELVSMRVSLSPATYPDGVSRQRFWDAALEQIEAIPGVSAVALSTETPPDDLGNLNNFDLEDRPVPEGQQQPMAAWVVVGPSYFDVLGMPLLEGRAFQRADLDDGAPPVLIVDEAWARANYPGQSAVGHRLYEGGQTTGQPMTVVGVVGSVPYEGIGASDRGAIYQPAPNILSSPFLMVRAEGGPASVVTRVRATLRGLDASAPVTEVATGTDLLGAALTLPRHLSLLAALFSAVAVALAVVGIYGITAYAVQQRRGDIAVRLALGGAPGRVLGAALWDGLRVSLVGLALGGGAAFLMTGALSSLLYQVTPRDPRSLAGAAVLLLTVSAVACFVPARRAVAMDPATTLREE
jgi:predicted permease